MTKLKSLRAELTQARAQVKALREAIAVEKRLTDRKSTRLNSSHIPLSRMPSSA